MKKARICDCGHHNAPMNIFCVACGEDISRLPVIALDEDEVLNPQAPEPDKNDSEAASKAHLAESEKIISVQSAPSVTFQLDNGDSFTAASGDIVGRSGAGSSQLEGYPTVSRNHLQVTFSSGRWLGKCLSDNGVWHNGQFMDVDEQCELNFGDELKLSSKCRVTVFS